MKVLHHKDAREDKACIAEQAPLAGPELIRPEKELGTYILPSWEYVEAGWGGYMVLGGLEGEI